MKLLYKDIKIPALVGKKIIADSKLFRYTDSDFKNWNTNVKGEKTKAQNLEVFEMEKNGTFEQIFGEIGDKEKLCLTQEQILNFVENHKDKLSGWYTFFLFRVGTEFFVAHVYLDDDGQLGVFVHRFSGDGVWHGEYRHRVVVPATDSKSLSIPDTLNSLTLESAIKLVKKEGYKIYKEI